MEAALAAAESNATPKEGTSNTATTAATAAAAADSSSNSTKASLILTSAKARGIFECDYCHSDISRLPRIRCAECPDFDLCLECFLTTVHTSASAIASLNASIEARSKVVNQGKQASSSSGDSAGQQQASSSGVVGGPLSSSINHNDSHGYRVCDNIRYPMFPLTRKVVPRPFGGSNSGGAESISGSATNDNTTNNNNNTEDQDGDAVMQDEDNKGEDETENVMTALSSDVKLIPDDPRFVWTVEEDLRLLEGIESHGLGNWGDIAEVVAGIGSVGKTPKRCMERYFDDFLGRYGHIVPPYTLAEDNNGGNAAAGAGGDVASNKEDGDDDNAESKDGVSTTDGGTSIAGSRAGSVAKDLDPTRLSKRKHSIMVRTSSASMQSVNRFSDKLIPMPTELLPEYQVVLDLYPNPRVPEKVSGKEVENPQVVKGQEVGRDQSVKSELTFFKAIGTMSKQDADKMRQDWIETKYMKPGGPTVLPHKIEDVVALPGSELAGYMPRRGDFDIEWENDAEQALADMEFLPGDLEQDKQLKLAVLKIYNEKLDERQVRKDFIRKRNLHDYRKNEERDAKMPRDERDLVRRMRVFERFHNPAEHAKFLDDILKAKKLRKEIAKFQMYRRLGITSLAEAERYELDKSRRNFHKDAAMRKESTIKKMPPGAAAAAEAAALAARKADKPDEATNSLWYEYKSTSRRRSSTNRAASQDSASGPVPPPAEPASGRVPVSLNETNEGMLKPAATTTSTMNDEKMDVAVEDTSASNGASLDDLKFKQTSDGKPIAEGEEFDIEKMEGARNLTTKEIRLCRRIRLTPKQYNTIKAVLIREAYDKGLTDRDGTNKRTLVMIDIEKRGNVIDFMVQAGWLTGKGANNKSLALAPIKDKAP